MAKYQSGPATRLNWTQFVIDSYSKILDVSIAGEPNKLINAMEIFSCALLAIGIADDEEYIKANDRLDSEKEDEIMNARRGNPKNALSTSDLNVILIRYAIKKLRITSQFLSRCGIAPEKDIELELDEGLEDLK
jgi:hypothetical protein